MNQIKEFRLEIACSIYLIPCTENDLIKRLGKNYSVYFIGRSIIELEKEGIYYKGDIMHINKKWAKKNLKNFDLDFRTKKEKEHDSLTCFAKQLKKQKLI